MKNNFLILLLLLFVGTASAQTFTVSGYVKDSASGEALAGATIAVKELNTGVAANEYGFYSISIPKGDYILICNSLGYPSFTKKIQLNANLKLNIPLHENLQALNTVEVSATKENENVKSVEVGVTKMDIRTIKKIPMFMGETDIIRSILFLPGISTVGEGSSGYNARGGSVDQNLILLDDAPVFNSSHLFGFFSVFNPDAVKDVTLTKGGIPAEYGERLSSVLDIHMKEGDNQKFDFSGGIGLVFSRFAVEGPIKKSKGSFIIAARRSYVDVLAQPFLISDLKGSIFNFYDLTLKANYMLNDKNRVYLSGYMGQDNFGAPGFSFNWGNKTATLRWNHLFNDKLFLNTSAIYSNYNYSLGFSSNNDSNAFKWTSHIISYSIKPEFSFFPNPQNTIKFGLQSSYYNFQPGTAIFTSGGESRNSSLPDKFALESAIYLENEQKIGARLILKYGLRYSFYQYLGSGTAYLYGDTTAGARKPLVGEQNYTSGQVIKQYANPEPRFSAKYDLTESSSLKISYMRTAQYIYLVSNTTASTPLDVWNPATNNIPPQLADQGSIGYYRNFGLHNDYETSVETYYKSMQHQVDYINDANLLLNPYIEGDLLNGIGRAYGVEFYVKKNKGKFTGWISYTLARTELKVDGINNNNWYPQRFNHTHDLNVVTMYDLNERWSFSANFVYMSGTPATFPTDRIELQGYIIPQNVNNSRNNYILPPYDRMDISATLQSKRNHSRKWQGSWVFSVYNVYDRRNPFSIFFQEDPNNPQVTQAVRYSIIGSAIPSIAYNFKF
ncbi:MAG: TonB-dependent receptor [Bacteroidia bacterium]